MKRIFTFGFLLMMFSFLNVSNVMAQPANDNVCDALDITLDGPAVVVSNIDATVEAGEQDIVPPGSTACDPGTWCDNNSPTGGPAFNHSLWFKFVAPASTAVNIDICGSTFDSQLALYKATDCADFSTFEFIYANDDQAGCGIDVGFSSTIRIECLTAGDTYHIVVDDWQNDATNPVDSGDVVIAITTEMKIDPGVQTTNTPTVVEPLCPGGNEGSIDIELISGVEPVTYLWAPGGETTQDISGLAAGTYTVTVTDFCGTSEVTSYDLEDPTEPAAIAFGSYPIEIVHPTHCGSGMRGGQISAPISEGVGPFTYAWSTGDTIGLVTGLADGEVTVTVTDNCGINTAERTYYVGATAGPDIDLETTCGDTQIGVDNAAAGGDITEVTYSTDQTTESGIACRGGGFIARSATWRSFDMATDFGVNDEWSLHGVEVFITSDPNYDLEVGVNVKFTAYIASTVELDDPNLQLITLDSIETFITEVPDYTPYLIPLRASGLGPTDILAVKVETLTSSGDGHRFDFSSNSTQTTQTTYITSDDCGLTTPIKLSDIGFDQQMVMNVFLDNGTGLSYEWGGPVDDPTSATPMALGTETTTYTVTITDDACGTTYTDDVTVSCWTVSTEDLVEESFTISPNPSNGEFIMVNEGASRDMNIQVFDLQGKLVYSNFLNIGSGDTQALNLNGLAKGIYMAKLANNNEVETHRLVIQ